jgi:hypothetical protein
MNEIVSVDVHADDAIRADNRAWLVRRPSAPRIEARSTVPPESERMIEVYARHRSSAASSQAIAVVDHATRLARSESGVIVATSTQSIAGSKVRVVDHPIAAHVRDWNAIGADATAALPPGDGWTPIVQADRHTLVAVREQSSTRQVWVGFSSSTFSRSSDFVIFWTDVFDWLGGDAASEFRTEPVSRLDPTWARDAVLSGASVTADPSPGVYRGRTGELRAMSATDLKITKSTSLDWIEKLANLLKHPRTGATTDLSNSLLLAALALIAVAGLFWNPRRASKTPTITPDQARAVAA